jgi:ankyrin repeat protein
MRPTPRAPACLLAVLLGAVASSAFDADYHKHELAIAAEQGSMESVVRLLDAGEDIDERDAAGRTAMHHASRMGHTEVLELLIAKGGDVNARTATGHTPLHEASATSQLGGWPFPP